MRAIATRPYHPPKRQIIFGSSDHQAPWRDGEQWRGLSMRPPVAEDHAYFAANPHRRIYLRMSISAECEQPCWMVVVRSAHDWSWNTVAFRFTRALRNWIEPQTDEDALAVVGRFDPQTMVVARLLLISVRYVEGICFKSFDNSARRS